MTEPTIILTRGIPGSGKTTYAKQWVAEDPANRVRANRDDLRKMLKGEKYQFDYATEQLVTEIQQTIAREALKQGKNVIVDDTNLRARHVKDWFKVGPVAFLDFEVDVETAIERDAARENPVGIKVILDFERRYIQNGKLPAPPVAEESKPFAGEKYVPDASKRAAFIFDIDGTLAHIDPANPRDVYDGSRVNEDRVDEHVRNILWDLQINHYRIIIVSGRDSKYREVTEAWLADKEIEFDHLYMRAEGDTRNDAIVKHEIFREHIATEYNVFGVFDDRNRVVEMWRSIGLKCFQVQEGDF